jgi:hypothetical protein
LSEPFWDVTDIAIKNGRMKRGGRVDDFLRESIGYRKGSTGEIHTLSADEMRIKVNKLLCKFDQKLPVVELGTYQYKIAEEILNQFKTKKVILADLCARFGKTIWSSAVGVELGVDIVIVSSYVLTSFASFIKDVTSFEQFIQYEHIDLGDDDYIDQYEKAIQNNKKVFVYLSLCNGSKRQERVNWLATQKKTKLLIIDEADFGAYKKGQAVPLVDKIDAWDYVILMTGTNSERAVNFWPVEHVISVTYPELLIQKSLSTGVSSK